MEETYLFYPLYKNQTTHKQTKKQCSYVWCMQEYSVFDCCGHINFYILYYQLWRQIGTFLNEQTFWNLFEINNCKRTKKKKMEITQNKTTSIKYV